MPPVTAELSNWRPFVFSDIMLFWTMLWSNSITNWITRSHSDNPNSVHIFQQNRKLFFYIRNACFTNVLLTAYFMILHWDAISILRTSFPGMGIAMSKIRRSQDRLIRYLWHGDPYTGKMTLLYKDTPLKIITQSIQIVSFCHLGLNKSCLCKPSCETNHLTFKTTLRGGPFWEIPQCW